MPSTIAISPDQKVIQELSALLALQKEAFLKNPYPSLAQRKELLERVPPMLIKYRQKIHLALKEDFGFHSTLQADTVEILGMIERVKYNVSKLSKWMKKQPKELNPITMGNSKAYIKYHPKGVVGNMVSWNFPFDIGLGAMIDQLAAGNKVIIKPSDLAPVCGGVFAEMIADTFDRTEVAVVNGGLDLAIHFPTLQWDHLIYTGSGVIGRKIMAAAAKNLVPVTLELGGKSPVIFDSESINEENIANLIAAKMIKRGQMCVTADYCFVPIGDIDKFRSQVDKFMRVSFPDNKTIAEHSTGIITQRHYDRLTALLEPLKSSNIDMDEYGTGETNDYRHLPFTVVYDPPNDSAVMQEEIFGPILPVIPYDSLEDVIDYINENDHPLGLYIYSDNKAFQNRIIENTRSGGVAINAVALQAAQPSLAFGGIGPSGMGIHHGEEAFKEFSNPRGYFIKGGGNLFGLFAPPYGDTAKNFVEKVAYEPILKQIPFALKRLPAIIWAKITER